VLVALMGFHLDAAGLFRSAMRIDAGGLFFADPVDGNRDLHGHMDMDPKSGRSLEQIR
jgi:hypothetical protein